MKKICIIPARAGSKRIPNKNIKKFNGKPIIYYPLSEINNSKIFDEIIVSSDSKKILNIVKKLGFKQYFIRPKSLSNDHVDTQAVISHAIDWCKKNYIYPKYICCVYPTSVFFNKNHLRDSFSQIKNKKLRFVSSAAKFPFSLQRSFFLNKKKNIKILNKKMYDSRSQDLKTIYYDAAQFYWGTPEAWKNSKFSGIGTGIFELPSSKVKDIDYLNDWKTSENLFSLIKSKKI
jgi:pseudaminic acid cytidylyltransferase